VTEPLEGLIDLFVALEELNGADSLASVAEAKVRASRSVSATERVRIVRQAVDARKGRPLGFRVRAVVEANQFETSATEAKGLRPPPAAWPPGRPLPRVVVVGSGPAGTWAALRLVEAGVACTVLERGQPVQPRRRDLAQLQRGTLNAESNYCFGEGGAGTYSDGKLYTRSKDKAAVAGVLADLVRFGAPADIAIEARPHVGSNRLPKVLTALRVHLEERGVCYRFGTSFAGLRSQRGKLQAVELNDGTQIEADAVILAVGHSARPVYTWAEKAGVAIERKGFAIGVRMEHPQPVINRMQYGHAAGHPRLPAAFYELKAQSGGRGVYSFCMCPGGWIVPASTEPGGVVVNGMSLSKRDSPFANSGLVVSVEPRDMGPDAEGPLAGLMLQRQIEAQACELGGGRLVAPASDLLSFINQRPARTSLGPTSYRPGVQPSELADVFPRFIVDALRDGLRSLCTRYPQLRHEQALLVATESRTSAPVRFLRDRHSLQSVSTPGLFPAGEGAGYAGGIVSAALDGVRVADAVLARARG